MLLVGASFSSEHDNEALIEKKIFINSTIVVGFLKVTYLGLFSSLPLNALDRMGLLFTHHIIGRLNSSAFLVEQTLTTHTYPFSPLNGSEMKIFFKS